MIEVEGKGRTQRMIDLLSSGVPLHVVSDLLGRESINTTAGYVTPSDAERQTAFDRAKS
jgi:site-specific recombinase XerD